MLDISNSSSIWDRTSGVASSTMATRFVAPISARLLLTDSTRTFSFQLNSEAMLSQSIIRSRRAWISTRLTRVRGTHCSRRQALAASLTVLVVQPIISQQLLQAVVVTLHSSRILRVVEH